jgi:NADH:ubiquinone reductase (H+-translocating)
MERARQTGIEYNQNCRNFVGQGWNGQDQGSEFMTGTDRVNHKPRVVIVGAGFAGINAAQALRQAAVEVVMVDRRNYPLFQPLLYQVATAGLSPEDIAYPIRAIFRRQENFSFRLTDVTSVDLDARLLTTPTGPISYDYLILAVGSETNFFGNSSLENNAFELKDIGDAVGIRNHVLRMFEHSTVTEDPQECEALRTFVVVGGGPTGVESSGSLSELIRLVLIKDFPGLDVKNVRVILIEMQDHILPGFPKVLSQGAQKTLQRKQVDVRLGETVAEYDGDQVVLKSGEVIRAHTLIWAAGVRAAGVVDTLGVELGRQARVRVEPTLQLANHPEVFVVGDAAYLEEEGQPLPMVAPVAIQQAKTAAANILSLLSGEPLREFDYRDPGLLATIGRNAAVARVGRFQFQGFFAWLIWLAVHLFWLIGFRNRLFVLVNWAWDYILYERAVRLITPKPEE